MKILHISDTHGFHDLFPNETFNSIDVVIHSGDVANYADPYRNEYEVLNFLAWYKTIPVKYKVLVAGNHDTSIEKRLVTPAQIKTEGIYYLENDGLELEGIKFWGSPITPTFGFGWAWNRSRDKTNKVWQQIPDDTDVLITHGPPKGVRDLSFDRNGRLEMCGDSALMKRCWVLRDTLKLVCFGHIHNMDGVDTNQGTSNYSNTKTIFSNGACVYDGRFDKGLTSHGNIIDL